MIITPLDCQDEANGFYPRLGFKKVDWWPHYPNTVFDFLTNDQLCKWELLFGTRLEDKKRD